MDEEDEHKEETHKATAEPPRSTRSSKIQKTRPRINQERSPKETRTKDEEATITSEPNNREERQEYAQHEPDTLEKLIEEMMDQADQDDYKTAKIQHQEQTKKAAQGTTSAGTEKPSPRPEMTTTTAMAMMRTTRHEQNPGETRKIDTGAPKKYEQGKCKKHQLDSSEQKLEAKMTTATPTEEEDTQRKKKNNTKEEKGAEADRWKNQQPDKKTCIREDTREEDKT